MSSKETPTSDRKCQDMKQCKKDLEYESTAPTITSDRECSNQLPSCRGDEYEKVEGSTTAKRVCAKAYRSCRDIYKANESIQNKNGNYEIVRYAMTEVTV